MSPRVKVCCIASLDEARMAIAAGASALGLVSAMPSGPGVIDEITIAEIASRLPPPIAGFLLTALQDGEAIVEQALRCRINTVQLVDAVAPAEIRRVRRAFPALRIVQVIHVRDTDSLDEARAAAPLVDALLLDSGNPNLAVKELGGTGRVHDWRLSRAICDAVAVPIFLAGGLHAGNVAAAVAAVHPFGLDLCSGVRSDGVLDGQKLDDFFTALAAASDLSRFCV